MDAGGGVNKLEKEHQENEHSDRSKCTWNCPANREKNNLAVLPRATLLIFYKYIITIIRN